MKIKPQAFDDSADGSPMTAWIREEMSIDDLLANAADVDNPDCCAVVEFTAAQARAIGWTLSRDDPNDSAHVGVAGLKNKTTQKKMVTACKVIHDPVAPPPSNM